jgi:hypothetical protein
VYSRIAQCQPVWREPVSQVLAVRADSPFEHRIEIADIVDIHHGVCPQNDQSAGGSPE